MVVGWQKDHTRTPKWVRSYSIDSIFSREYTGEYTIYAYSKIATSACRLLAAHHTDHVLPSTVFALFVILRVSSSAASTMGEHSLHDERQAIQ